MFHLACAGKLLSCPSIALKRPRFTCLYCRLRRRHYKNFTEPPFWIDYTLKSTYSVKLVESFTRLGVTYVSSSGKKLELTSSHTIHIDPRGHFTSLRSASIIVLDTIMEKTGIQKPILEVCEFLASYPNI